MNQLQKFLSKKNWKEYAILRSEIIKQTGCSRQTWSNWIRGKNDPAKIYKNVINKCANEIFNEIIYI